jgi:hypothetical protein
MDGACQHGNLQPSMQAQKAIGIRNIRCREAIIQSVKKLYNTTGMQCKCDEVPDTAPVFQSNHPAAALTRTRASFF